MVIARRVAPFVYVIIGLICELTLSDRVAGTVWVVGALIVGALYASGLGRRNSERSARRAAERAERRGR